MIVYPINPGTRALSDRIQRAFDVFTSVSPDAGWRVEDHPDRKHGMHHCETIHEGDHVRMVTTAHEDSQRVAIFEMRTPDFKPVRLRFPNLTIPIDVHDPISIFNAISTFGDGYRLLSTEACAHVEDLCESNPLETALLAVLNSHGASRNLVELSLERSQSLSSLNFDAAADAIMSPCGHAMQIRISPSPDYPRKKTLGPEETPELMKAMPPLCLADATQSITGIDVRMINDIRIPLDDDPDPIEAMRLVAGFVQFMDALRREASDAGCR